MIFMLVDKRICNFACDSYQDVDSLSTWNFKDSLLHITQLLYKNCVYWHKKKIMDDLIEDLAWAALALVCGGHWFEFSFWLMKTD